MQGSFLTNYSDISFLDKIRDNLRQCRSFYFSVSFIKKAGLILLINDISAALERGSTGKLITSTYQNFTDIESLTRFAAFSRQYANFECRLDMECFHDRNYAAVGYHSKGYLFEFDDSVEVIVGSSNITRYALLKNIEWDLVIRENSDKSEVFDRVRAEFDDMWDRTLPLTADLISRYAQRLHYSIERWDMDYDLEQSPVKPNYMQRSALKEINRYRAVGSGRVLIVAAAGSGKTLLSAFDALNFNPHRLLYVVHEGSILQKSLETYQLVFGNSVTCGMYTGQVKELDADFLFASRQMLSRSLKLFSPDEFDYIVIDECHHAAAESYRRIIDYFEPEFLLGLTATPERMDNQDVFDLFDNNVPFELRLRDAIINGLVVPFKYYGIRDQLVDYGIVSREERRMAAQSVGEEHCSFIAREIEKHRTGGKLKAIAFCRSISHARMMCEAMGEHYHTACLTGKNDIGQRIRAYNDLQSDASELEILFTVDILNEGVDIPGINMVLFLRPTDSSTVFIQQLGRGLRRFPGKDCVPVLDFIGNSYKRSVQIVFALSSLSDRFILEKNLMKSMVRDDFSALYLASYGVEIHIDKLSKEEILSHLDSENFYSFKYIKQDFYNFKKYIHAPVYPTHLDYINNDCAPDLLHFMNIRIGGKKTNSYYQFLHCVLENTEDEKYLPVFLPVQIAFIDYLSSMLPLVRPHEYIIVRSLLTGPKSIRQLADELSDIPKFCADELNHALEYMLKASSDDHDFFTQRSGLYHIDIPSGPDFRGYLDDLIDYGLKRFEIDFGDTAGFKLWQNYRLDQVQLKLCKNPGYTMKGTYIYNNIIYIFASIHKDASIEDHLNYKDKFLEPAVFQWECESGLSPDRHRELIDSIGAHLFIRKAKEEYGMRLPFIYTGTGRLTNPRKTDNPKGSLLFDIIMDQPLPDYLQYDFGLTDNP